MYTLVDYRTKSFRHESYAVLPEIWLSVFLDWLRLSGHTLVSVRRIDSGHLRIPEAWPSYQTCLDYVSQVELVR